MPIPIRIGLYNGQVRPENDPPHTINNRTTTVPRGESIMFTIPSGFSAVSITFDDVSPFGLNPQDKVVGYGETRQIPSTAPAGVFAYTCEIIDSAGAIHKSGGGGEIEVGK
jgi:hypothetical protein